MDDWDLICAYRIGSENTASAKSAERAQSAFSELVQRHVHLVYSAAHRSLGYNAALAEDVVQKTFALFARKVHSFTPSASVVGWLYKTTCNISREVARSESRRHSRETEAASMQTHSANPEDNSSWDEIAPLLEQGMSTLSENDRVTLLLRFFERKPFREIAATLGVTEDAAKMRVSRALQKLRSFFSTRGVSISATALGTVLWENSVNAAPAALLGSLTAAQLTSATVPLSIATKWILMTNLQKASVVAISLLLISLTGYQVQRKYAQRSASRPQAASVIDAEAAPARASNSSPADAAASVVSHPDPRVDRALANLRQIISDPWPNRRLPTARLQQALDDLGPNRKAAIPLLLEFLNSPRAQRSLTAMCSAGYCFELLGSEASAALPDLLTLTGSGDLAILNDGVPKLFSALSPDGAILPQLIQILGNPPQSGAQQIQITINKLIDLNPTLADVYRPQIAAILANDNPSVRLNAATALARLPGPKDPAALPVLVDALAIERLRDPKAYDPINIGNNTIMNRNGLRFEDEIARAQAVQALGEMGPAAQSALPLLTEFARLSSTNTPFPCRDRALAAIDKIDPEARRQSPDLDATLRAQERAAELLKKTKSGTASFAELEEGLRTREAVDFAAQALAGHPEARATIPSLIEAVDRFASYEAVERIKELDPHHLIERVKEKNTNALNAVAQALGDLGPAMSEALPHLRQLLDETRSDDSDRGRAYALNEAIHKIDPTQPKLLYKFDDLHPATSALVQAIYAQEKIHSPIYDTYIRDFQDINAVSRGQLLRFVETTKSDTELHALFVKKLLENNPDLATDLQPGSVSPAGTSRKHRP